MSLNEYATSSTIDEFCSNAIYNSINYDVFTRTSSWVDEKVISTMVYLVSFAAKVFEIISINFATHEVETTGRFSTTGVPFPKHDFKSSAYVFRKRFEIAFWKNRNNSIWNRTLN